MLYTSVCVLNLAKVKNAIGVGHQCQNERYVCVCLGGGDASFKRPKPKIHKEATLRGLPNNLNRQGNTRMPRRHHRITLMQSSPSLTCS